MVESLLEQLGTEATAKKLLTSFRRLKVNNLKRNKNFANKIARAELLGEKADSRKLQEDFALVSKLKMEWEKAIK